MSPDDQRHGTNAGAVQHWRDGETPCDACQTGKRRSAKGAALDRERGNPRTVHLGADAHRIVASSPRDQLARATGLTVHKLCRLTAAGPDAVVHRRTRDRILAAGGIEFWTAVGVQRRLRALHAIGWSMRALAAETGGGHPTNLLNLVRRAHPQFVRRDFAERVLDAYDRLCMTPQHGRGASRARNLAAAKGWAPPLAWDDIDHDQAPTGAGPSSPLWPRQDLAAEWDHLRRLGVSLEEAAARLGRTPAAIEKAVERTSPQGAVA